MKIILSLLPLFAAAQAAWKNLEVDGLVARVFAAAQAAWK